MVKQIKMSDFILPQFKEFWKVSRAHEYLRYVMKGGRAGGKSFVVPFRVVNDIMEYPVSALCLRKVQNTVLKSIYANMKAAIYMLGVEHLFRCVDSRLEITYLPRGNKIYFSGADDPEKIKSIKDAKFPISIMVIEELAEFKNEDEVTMIENSVLRAELDIESDYRPGRKFAYSFYYMYNPPKRKHNWVNKKYESAFIDKNTYVHHSTYLGNPYVSKAFIDEAENVKKRNELKYRWEYMGEAIGSGIVPFPNLEFRTITDEEFNSFDNLRQGMDEGYGPDPFAFVQWHYDKKRDTIYAMREVYKHQTKAKILANDIIAMDAHRRQTIADSAAKRFNDTMRDYGLKILDAKKGPDSVERGETWLSELDRIVIDPKRTPNIAKEFENIDFMTDKEGNPLPRLADKDNHTINISVVYKRREIPRTLKCQLERKLAA